MGSLFLDYPFDFGAQPVHDPAVGPLVRLRLALKLALAASLDELVLLKLVPQPFFSVFNLPCELVPELDPGNGIHRDPSRGACNIVIDLLSLLKDELPAVVRNKRWLEQFRRDVLGLRGLVEAAVEADEVGAVSHCWKLRLRFEGLGLHGAL